MACFGGCKKLFSFGETRRSRIQGREEGDIHKFPQQILKPYRLKQGSTIGIAAPASPFDTQKLSQGRALLEAMGFNTVAAEGLFSREGYLAGDDALRATQMMRLVTDSDVDAIMGARGGYGSLRILSLLDWQMIGRLAKPLIGFSDLSVLHQVHCLRTGLISFHGPMVCSLPDSDQESLNALRQALTADRPACLSVDRKIVLKAGQAEGVLVGGNLTSLCHLVGTPYSVRYDKCILFLEDIGEAPYRIDRMLLQMDLAGCFEGLAAVALGSFTDCGEEDRIHAIVVERFARHAVPILAGFGMGHGKRNLTWPLGMICRLVTRSGQIEPFQSATREKGRAD